MIENDMTFPGSSIVLGGKEFPLKKGEINYAIQSQFCD